MCPVCLAASGLYVAGGLSAGAVTTFLATKLLRKQPEPIASGTSTKALGRQEEDGIMRWLRHHDKY